MTSPKARLGAAALVLLSFAPPSSSADQVLIAPGSTWKYNDSGANLGTAWRAAAYNDAAWASGLAQLGYGDGDESTVVGFGGNTSNRYITTYFRRAFTVANPAAITGLTLRYVRDDGAVIYLNGTEVVRSNMPTGTIAYNTLSPVAIGGTDESAWQQTPIPTTALVAGTNVIAVEIHQQAANSSDISFNLELIASTPTPAPPTVSLVAPGNGGVSNTTSVTFQANAASTVGLASATLYIGPPPQTVTFTGPTQIEDAQITADTPTTPNGSGASLNVDGQSPHAHTLMKFPTLIGASAGQVPAGTSIQSATLQVNCTNLGAMMKLYRLTQDWSEAQTSWNERSTGVPWGSPGADGAASRTTVSTDGDCTATGWRSINLTGIVQEWASGAANYGIVFTDSGTDGIDFDSSESAVSPVLTVVYRSAKQAIETKAISGTSSSVSFTTTLALGQSYAWNVRALDTQSQEGWAAADFGLTVDSSSPDAPVLVSPANGATGVAMPPQLAATVTNPDGGNLDVAFEIRKAAPAEFTIIALPDTQHYSEQYPQIFTNQTQWIVNNKAARNIVFVTHEGDIVQNVNNVTEWERANTSLSLLDGVVPYGMGPGNHDEPTTLYNQYFPYTRYQNQPWYGGHYSNNNDNNYQLISAGGMDFVILHLDFCPAAAVVSWADSILKQYPQRIGMVTTHAYLGLGAVRNTHVCGSTQYLWDGLAPGNPNLHFMLSGHVHGEARRSDIVNGHPVQQMLADYQDRTNGGDGWLRILRFVPGEDKIYVQTYSPWLNQYESDADSEFTLDFPMAGAFTSLGSVTVANGATAAMSAPNLLANTKYEWRAKVTNGNAKTRVGPVWSFTTAAANQPPAATGDSYSATAGTPLTVTAPGVLSNDSDPENQALSAVLAGNVSNGTLSLNANGGFTYTANAGFVGADSFTYRASDGALQSNVATVTLNVSPPPPVISADFNSTVDGFTYADNVFRGATQGAYANGARVDSGGFTGGALVVQMGGGNNTLITGMSGGWWRAFTLVSPRALTLTFRYYLNQGAHYESNEISQVLAIVDGTLRGVSPNDYIAQIIGNGDGGAVLASGWQQVSIPLGTMPAGSHYVILGGYNNRKDATNEQTTVVIDDVVIQ